MFDVKKTLWAILAAVILLYIWPIVLRLLVYIFPFKDIATLGQYGDSFGALTAMFTAAAFLVLYLTLAAQKEELKLQREEMKLQRKEMEKSRETFDGQKKVMALQLFETTFFNLLQQHYQILSSYSLSLSSPAHILSSSSRRPDHNRIEDKGNHALRRFINMELLHIESMETFYASFNNKILVLQNLYYSVCSLIEHVEEDTSGFIDKNKYKKIISRELHLDEKFLLCVICWKLKDDNMKSLFRNYIFDKQELEVKGFEEYLIKEINTYFNPNP